MPINKKVYDLCGEVMADHGLYGERHHIRGRAAGAQLGALNDILICGIIPAMPGHSETVHLHGTPRDALKEYINSKDVYQLRNLILACNAQVGLILTRGAWETLWK